MHKWTLNRINVELGCHTDLDFAAVSVTSEIDTSQPSNESRKWTNLSEGPEKTKTFFPLFSPLQILHLDLSSSIIPTSALESIICRCRLLECLSLEGLQLSDSIIRYCSTFPVLHQGVRCVNHSSSQESFVMWLIPPLMNLLYSFILHNKENQHILILWKLETA